MRQRGASRAQAALAAEIHSSSAAMKCWYHATCAGELFHCFFASLSLSPPPLSLTSPYIPTALRDRGDVVPQQLLRCRCEFTVQGFPVQPKTTCASVLDGMGDRLECLATSPAAVATRQVMKASAEQAFVNMLVCSITVAAVEQPCGPVVACHLRFLVGNSTTAARVLEAQLAGLGVARAWNQIHAMLSPTPTRPALKDGQQRWRPKTKVLKDLQKMPNCFRRRLVTPTSSFLPLPVLLGAVYKVTVCFLRLLLRHALLLSAFSLNAQICASCSKSSLQREPGTGWSIQPGCRD